MNKKSFAKFRIPLRLSLGGGGTDIEPFAGKEGSTVINFAIDKFLKFSIESGKLYQDNPIEIKIYHVDNNVESKRDSEFIKKLTFVVNSRFALKLGRELRINIHHPVSQGSGLGSSSAMIAGLLFSIKHQLGLGLELDKLAFEAFSVERRELGIAGGFQDYFPALFGGLNLITQNRGEDFPKTSKVDIPESFSEFVSKSLYCFSLPRRTNGNLIIADQIEKSKNSNSDSFLAQRELAGYTAPILQSIKLEQYHETVRLIDLAYSAKKRLSPLIATNETLEVEKRLRSIGARGIKISGAGGGGHMFCFFMEGVPDDIAEELPIGSLGFPVAISQSGVEFEHEDK